MGNFQLFLNFLGEHPILSFFLFAIVAECIVCSLRAIRGVK